MDDETDFDATHDSAAAVPEAEDGRAVPPEATLNPGHRGTAYVRTGYGWTPIVFVGASVLRCPVCGAELGHHHDGSHTVPARDDERERLAAAAALHTGLHQCIGGQWYSDSEPSYRGTVAAHTACPTAALIRAALAAPLPEGQEGT